MKKPLLFLTAITLSTSVLAQSSVTVIEEIDRLTNLTEATFEKIRAEKSTNNSNNKPKTTAAYLISDNSLRLSIDTKIDLKANEEYTIAYKLKKYSKLKNSDKQLITLTTSLDGDSSSITKDTFKPNDRLLKQSTKFTPTKTGKYNLNFSVNKYDANGLEVLIDKIYISQKQSASSTKEKQTTLYPTKLEEQIHINTKNITNTPLSISVYDTNNQKQNIKLNSNSLDYSVLKPGAYFLKIKTNTIDITKKIVKL